MDKVNFVRGHDKSSSSHCSPICVNSTRKKSCNDKNICGEWSTRSPMSVARENFAIASGPDKGVTGTVLGIDQDPRVYVFGGLDKNGNSLDSCEKYDPNTDTWSNIASLPQPLGNCNGAFAPDCGKNEALTLGYIYVVGGNIPKLFQYNIQRDKWNIFELPFSVVNAALHYLDDFGGPLAELLIALTGVDFPACSDSQIIWVVGGEGTEQQTWYIESNIRGELVGEWTRGPNLPLFRKSPLIGRVFWRDAGITSYGVSNCASIAVCGGVDRKGKISRDVQLLIRNSQCNWMWIDSSNSSSKIPKNLLTLTIPVSNGAFGTEQWPETLVTGGRPILFGGNPPAALDEGSVQYAQLRFVGNRYRRDPDLPPGPQSDSAWNTTTNMPGHRTNFKSAPLSQENSSRFGGRRISRFLCVGGLDSNGKVTARSQLFELPVPSPFLVIREDSDFHKQKHHFH